MVRDELLDLVDEDDNVIGQMMRNEAYAKGLNNIRVINAFVVNSNGELWIPRRTADKRLFPSCLDVSVGGHVGSGDGYDETFKREAAEELTIDTDTVPTRLLGHLSAKDGVHCHMHVYEIRADDVPDYNRSDFSEHYWLTPQAALDRIAGGDKGKDDLAPLIRHFYIKGT